MLSAPISGIAEVHMTIKIIATIEELRDWNVGNDLMPNQVFKRHEYEIRNNMVGIRHRDDHSKMYGIPLTFVKVMK